MTDQLLGSLVVNPFLCCQLTLEITGMHARIIVEDGKDSIEVPLFSTARHGTAHSQAALRMILQMTN